MRKVIIIMSLMSVLALCVLACSSQVYEFSEDVAATEATQSRGVPQITERQRQVNEVAKHIKFEKDTFFIEITLDEAMQRGVSADIYNKWLERLEEYTLKARKTIANGGKFYFVNAFAQAADSLKPADDIPIPMPVNQTSK